MKNIVCLIFVLLFSTNFSWARSLTTADFPKITEIYHEANVITVPPNATAKDIELIGLLNAEEKWLKPTRFVKIGKEKIQITLRDEIQILRWNALKQFGPSVAELSVEEKAYIDDFEDNVRDEINKNRQRITALKADPKLKRQKLSQTHPIGKAVFESITSAQSLAVLVLDGIPYALNNNNGTGALISMVTGTTTTPTRMRVRSGLNGLFCSGMTRTPPTGTATYIQVDDINYARIATAADYNSGTSIFNINTQSHSAFCVNEVIHRDSLENPGVN